MDATFDQRLWSESAEALKRYDQSNLDGSTSRMSVALRPLLDRAERAEREAEQLAIVLHELRTILGATACERVECAARRVVSTLSKVEEDLSKTHERDAARPEADRAAFELARIVRENSQLRVTVDALAARLTAARSGRDGAS